MLKTFPDEAEAITEETVLVEPVSPRDIKLFDRVVVRGGERHHRNFVGTVLDINSSGSIGIYWPSWKNKGHSLDGHSPTGQGGWYYPWEYVLLVEDPAFDIPDNIASIMDELL